MTQTLKTVQTIARVAKVIAIIAYVCSIIGAIGSAVGLAALAVFDIFGVDIGAFTDLIVPAEQYYTQLLALVYCIGEIIVTKVAISYLSSELDVGTPFTLRGAADLRRVSVFAIVVPIAVSVVQGVLISLLSLVVENTGSAVPYETDIGLGIFLLILSVVFKCGTEMIKESPDVTA